MKRTNILLIVLFLISGLANLSFAETAQAKNIKKIEANTEVIKGKVVSIDAVKGEMVVNEFKTGTERSITINPKIFPALKVGENVIVTFKEGANVASSVKKIIKKAPLTKNN